MSDFRENLYNKNVFRKALKGSKVNNLYPKSTSGAQTLAAADASNDRNVLIVVEVTETFADGDGAQPVVIVGETSTTNKFAANTLLASAKAGDKFVLAGKLLATTALLVTVTAATGSTSTGPIKVSAAIFPVTI